ncbi:MAG: esterase [Oscillospiraceae bacterium]|nr:esterase [Oscillospiraceae bacterium]
MDLIEYGNSSAKTVLIQPVDDRDLASIEKELSLIREKTAEDFRLVAFRVKDWNSELSPWNAPAVFGSEAFSGGAAETLAEMTAFCSDPAATYYIGGYSLAGLFALWAAYQSDLFHGAAAASPSVWFPGFVEFMKENTVRSRNIYLSLGSREEKTRNPVMATVGDRIREAYQLLREQNVNCVLEWNEGNHFKDPEMRTARAFSWVIGQKTE